METMEWLKGLTEEEVAAVVLLGMEELVRRGWRVDGVIWTGEQWAVVEEPEPEAG